MGQFTPKDVASTAQDGQAVAQDLTALLKKTSTDPKFTAQLITLAKEGNAAELAKFVTRTIKAKSLITVEAIDTDWCLRFVFRNKKGRVLIRIQFGSSCG